MRSCHPLLVGLLEARLFMAANALSYPATLELDVVFPRNDTYAVVAPFPIVFAFQNAGAFWEFGAVFQWSVSCHNLSLAGSSSVTASRTSSPGEPYIYVNASYSPNIRSDLSPGRGPFPLWGGDRDACKLDWLITYVSECTRYPNGSVITSFGAVQGISGNVNFTLAPSGGKLPANQLGGYADRPLYGGSIQVESKELPFDTQASGCPHFGSNPAAASPCAVSFASLAPSVLGQIPTPTVTFVPTTTQFGASKTSTSAPTPPSGGNTRTPNTASSKRKTTKESIAAYLFLSFGFLGCTLFL
jgi:hypothetical protein